MPGPREITAAAMVGCALAAAGCGGGPRRVSAEELVANGDAICIQTQQRFAEIQSHPPGSATEGLEQTKALLRESEDELDALRDLEPPDELRDPYDRYLEALGRALEFFRRGQDAAEVQDSQAYVTAQTEVAKTAPERRQLAEAVGLKACSATS